MKRVFVSSAIKGFEPFRAAAKAGIELMGHIPVMSEEFGARAYSSRHACLTEVEQSDVFIVVLGTDFGFECEPGISVTRAEFRHSRAVGKPVLAFVQDVHMDAAQAQFRREVENFESGFFRASFSTPEQLKDQVVRALRQLGEAARAWPEEQFIDRVRRAAEGLDTRLGSRDPRLTIAFLPQPEVRVHLPDLEADADALFTEVCNARLASLRDGYEMEGDAESLGIRSGATKLSIFQDGLRLISLRPQLPGRGSASFDDMFVPPSYVQELAAAAFQLLDANSGWCQIALDGMQHHAMRERPSEHVRSVSLPMYSEDSVQERRLFQPLTRSAYEVWVKQVVELFVRRFRA